MAVCLSVGCGMSVAVCDAAETKPQNSAEKSGVLQGGVRAGNVSKAEALPRIQKQMDTLAKLKDGLQQKYFYEKAAGSMKQAFQQAGVGKAMMYAEDWANNNVWVDWHYTKQFYMYHDSVLKNAAASTEAKGYITEADLAYLEQGMAQWTQLARQVDPGYQQLIRIYTDMAKTLDEKFRVQDQLKQVMRQSPHSEAEVTRLRQQEKFLNDRVKRIREAALRHRKANLSGKYEKLQVFSFITQGNRVALDATEARLHRRAEDPARSFEEEDCTEVELFRPHNIPLVSDPCPTGAP